MAGGAGTARTRYSCDAAARRPFVPRPMTLEDFDFGALARQGRESEPSPRQRELRRLADAGRAVVERLVATDASSEVLALAADSLQAVATSLGQAPVRSVYDGFAEAANAGDPHAFFDSSPIIGAANPLAPPLVLEAVGDEVSGRARFGAAYEGPPGCVHGGYLAAAFDEVLGLAQSTTGKPGMTGNLTVRYRRPTPLREELVFRGWVERTEGRKIYTAGTVAAAADGQVTAEAEAVFVSVDFAKLAAGAANLRPGDA